MNRRHVQQLQQCVKNYELRTVPHSDLQSWEDKMCYLKLADLSNYVGLLFSNSEAIFKLFTLYFDTPCVLHGKELATF